MIQLPLEQQFSELLSIINYHRSRASQAVNSQQLLTAWNVGAYISNKLKTNQWGSRVVTQFVEHMKVNAPDIKGFGRANIYNMVMFYDEYSSSVFISTVAQFIPNQSLGRLGIGLIEKSQTDASTATSQIVQMPTAQFVQSEIGQMPNILLSTSYTNHIVILNHCKSPEEKIILYFIRRQRTIKSKRITAMHQQ